MIDSLIILLKFNYMNLEKNINNMNTNEKNLNKKEVEVATVETPIKKEE